MNKRRTWRQYRAIDLTLFAIMLVIFEFIIIMAARFWFPGQPFTVSLAAAIVTIVYMRWGWWGGIHAALAGIVFCFFQGASPSQYLIYVAGNLFSLLSVFVLKKVGKEKVRTETWGMFYPVLVLLLMQTGRAVIALLLGAEPAGIVGFYTTDSLTMLFTFVIIWIARRLDGVYEDQIHYLLRINAKEGTEKEVNYES
ncbi:MAG TPA: hypothetical protein DCF49_06275 [Lachnospiraceae bacterium]|nr:hypothetical protein [Lachnospiraceae bacterium]